MINYWSTTIILILCIVILQQEFSLKRLRRQTENWEERYDKLKGNYGDLWYMHFDPISKAIEKEEKK